MNEVQLETFLTVVKYKSYSKAAVVLNVTQPTVTARIKALEDILQCEIFERDGHEIFLTKEGNMLIDYAKNILVTIAHSKEITNMVKEPIIKVGFSPGYSYSYIVELLKTIKSIDDMDIQVIEGHDSVILNEMILTGEVDLVFTRDSLPNTSDVISEYLFDNKLVLALPKNHHLCRKEAIHIEDLNKETIISFRRNTTLWKLVDEQLIGTKDLTRIDVHNNEMLLKAVGNEIGVGIIPELGIDARYETAVEFREINEIHDIPNQVYVHYRKTSQMENLAKKIIYSIIQHKYSEA